MADPKVPLAEAINEFVPVALKKAYIDARDAWSELLSALAATDERWKDSSWIERFMRRDGNEPPGIDQVRRADAALRSGWDDLIADLLAQLGRGDLIGYMRADPITGDLFAAPAVAWHGTVYVHGHGSASGKRPNPKFNFRDGSVFFWREGLTFYDVQIARRVVEEEVREPESDADLKAAPIKIVHAAITRVYDTCKVAGEKPPNKNELPAKVHPILEAMGYWISGNVIKKLADQSEHKKRRGAVGVRFQRNKRRPN